MSLDCAIGPLVIGTLIAMMVATGLGARLAEIAGAARDRRLVLRTGLANSSAVPFVAVVLLRLPGADPAVAAGFLILAVCRSGGARPYRSRRCRDAESNDVLMAARAGGPCDGQP